MSSEEINAMVAPVDEAAPAVMQWLSENGIEGTLSSRKTVITATVPVDKMETLLGAEYNQYSKIRSQDSETTSRTPR